MRKVFLAAICLLASLLPAEPGVASHGQSVPNGTTLTVSPGVQVTRPSPDAEFSLYAVANQASPNGLLALVRFLRPNGTRLNPGNPDYDKQCNMGDAGSPDGGRDCHIHVSSS